jgi:hypothetical protein
MKTKTESKLARAFRAKIEAANLSTEAKARISRKLAAAKEAFAAARDESTMNGVGFDIWGRGGHAV